MLEDPIARLLALGGELTTRRKFDLAHMRRLLAALGDPQDCFSSVLIAGTNGKGSTAATLASILQAGGTRTGLYTSPHLVRPNERIQVDGEPISAEALSRLFLQVEAAAGRLVAAGALPYPPSFFETMTAIGFLYFASAPVGIAILECGLGGRLDATNVVTPLLAILTDISLDHQEWLGDTIAAITREKCGILREGGTLVTLPQHPEANQAIGEIAVPLRVHAISASGYMPVRMRHAPATEQRSRYRLTLPAEAFGGGTLEVDSPLPGEHQQRNLALALAAAEYLHRREGFPLDKATVAAGVRNTVWPGRLQLLRPKSPRMAGPLILLDAAHNPAGAWALRAALSSLDVPGPRILLFGCMQDKAVDELAQVLFPIFDQVVLTRSTSTRAASLARLTEAAGLTGMPAQAVEVLDGALQAALAATGGKGLLTIAGSIALIGACMPLLTGWE